MASPRARPPVRVSDVLAAAVPGLGEHLLVERIRARWAEVVGPEGARRSRPERLRDGVLAVQVDSSPWLHELTLRSGELLARAQAAHGGRVTALRFALGRLPRPAAARPAPPDAPEPVLGPEDHAEIERLTAGVGDPALAAALGRLLTKDRLARRRPDARPGQPHERHHA
jgi:hypothetical protein